MLDTKKVKLGATLWSATFTEQCPCLVIEVTQEGFRIQPFGKDACAGNGWVSFTDDLDRLSRMQLCSMKDVESYIEEERKKHEADVKKRRLELTEAQRSYDTFKEKSEATLNEAARLGATRSAPARISA